jgi:hypothetical protein
MTLSVQLERIVTLKKHHRSGMYKKSSIHNLKRSLRGNALIRPSLISLVKVEKGGKLARRETPPHNSGQATTPHRQASMSISISISSFKATHHTHSNPYLPTPIQTPQ